MVFVFVVDISSYFSRVKMWQRPTPRRRRTLTFGLLQVGVLLSVLFLLRAPERRVLLKQGVEILHLHTSHLTFAHIASSHFTYSHLMSAYLTSSHLTVRGRSYVFFSSLHFSLFFSVFPILLCFSILLCSSLLFSIFLLFFFSLLYSSRLFSFSSLSSAYFYSLWRPCGHGRAGNLRQLRTKWGSIAKHFGKMPFWPAIRDP